MKNDKRTGKWLLAAMIAVLLLAVYPVTALASSFSAVVTASEMTVYKSASMTGTSATLPKGTVVTVKGYKGSIAKISYKGYTGYALISDMEAVKKESATRKPEADPTAAPESGTNVTLQAALRVYSKATTGSQSAVVPAGTKLTVAKSQNGWSKLTHGGTKAYAVTSELEAAIAGRTTVSEATPAPTAAPEATPAPTAAPEKTASVEKTASPVATPTPVPAVVSAEKMDVYETASLKARVLGTLKKGDEIGVSDTAGDWAKIEKDGYTGFALKSQMIAKADVTAAPQGDAEKTASPTAAPTAAPAPSGAVNAVVNTSGSALTLRAGASASAQSLAKLPKGTQVLVTAVENGWARVEVQGHTGYVSAKYLKMTGEAPAATAEPTAAPTAAPAPAETAKNAIAAVVRAKKLAVYEKASTKSKVLGTVKAGETVSVLDASGSWVKLEKDGHVGYALKTGLTTASAEQTAAPAPTATAAPASIPAMVRADGLKVYQKTSSGSRHVATLSKGDLVNVVAVSGSWAMVEKDGQTGYVLKGGLTAAPDATPTPAATAQPTATPAATAQPQAQDCTVSVEKLVVYKKASTSAAKLGTLKKGESIRVLATASGWAKVEKDGAIGYCKTAGLICAGDEPTPTPTATATATPEKVKFQATVTTAKLNVYAAPSTEAAKLGSLKSGATVDVYDYSGSWAYIGIGEKRAYAPISGLSGSAYQQLSTGDSGDDVKKLNDALLSLGYYDGTPGSSYDSATSEAVKRLQAAMGLTETGTADSALLRVLYSGKAPKSPVLSVSLSKGSSGTSVQRLQQRLYALGYLSKAGSVDASFGSTTQNAVMLFQKALGVTADGVADEALLSKLYSDSAPKLPSDQKAADAVAATPVEDTDKGSTDNSPLSAEGTAKVETIIAAAKEKLGCKYVFAATGPDVFDCSGLVRYCFAKVGISLPHSAYSIGYGSAGTKIAFAGLVRGDVICLNTLSDNDLSDHVGIYLGGGQYLHASSGKGQVIISDLTSGYYQRVFSWGKRFIY